MVMSYIPDIMYGSDLEIPLLARQTTVVFSTLTEGLRTIVESKVGELVTSNLTASGIAAMSSPLRVVLKKVWALFCVT